MLLPGRDQIAVRIATAIRKRRRASLAAALQDLAVVRTVSVPERSQVLIGMVFYLRFSATLDSLCPTPRVRIRIKI